MMPSFLFRSSAWIFVFLFCSLTANETAQRSSKPYLKPYSKKSASRHLKPLPHPKPELIGASHTEGKGLGYTRGYTSLDLFLSQPFCRYGLVPFLDLRGHMLNDANYAANAGLGLRWLNRWGQVWGANWFYDYFETPRRPYNQVAMGLEVLSTNWAVYLNGYLPVGHKKTPLYQFSYLSLDPFLLKGTEQFAMNGVDAEFGYRFGNFKGFDLYAGIGPYYYWGRSAATENALNPLHKRAIGGRFSGSASFLNYLSLEGVVTYDSLFRWGGQLTLAVTVPFDFTYNTGNCPGSYCLQERLYQTVHRNEIIVVDRVHRYSTDPNILDPNNVP